jgi:hypothetical protein
VFRHSEYIGESRGGLKKASGRYGEAPARLGPKRTIMDTVVILYCTFIILHDGFVSESGEFTT